MGIKRRHMTKMKFRYQEPFTVSKDNELVNTAIDDARNSIDTLITEIKKVKKGDGVGYDFSEKLSRDSKIAVLPVGYWHGLPRSLSSIGYFLVSNKQAKIIGRVSMDMTTIDISGLKVKEGDLAVLDLKNAIESFNKN